MRVFKQLHHLKI